MTVKSHTFFVYTYIIEIINFIISLINMFCLKYTNNKNIIVKNIEFCSFLLKCVDFLKNSC